MSALTDYQLTTRRTWRDHGDPVRSRSHCALGVSEEAGEVVGVVKRHIGYGEPLDRAKLTRELGDLLWYLARLADEVGVTLDEVAEVNVAKLRARYPEGWSAHHAVARLDGEDTGTGKTYG